MGEGWVWFTEVKVNNFHTHGVPGALSKSLGEGLSWDMRSTGFGKGVGGGSG